MVIRVVTLVRLSLSRKARLRDARQDHRGAVDNGRSRRLPAKGNENRVMDSCMISVHNPDTSGAGRPLALTLAGHARPSSAASRATIT